MISLERSTPAARRRLATRILAGIAAVALLIGLIVGATTLSGAQKTARSFADAWQRGDYSRMYSLLTPGAQKRVSPLAFRSAYTTASVRSFTSSLRRMALTWFLTV